MPTALITGVSGQDGSYLAELLLGEGYEVHGLVREGGLGSAGHLRGRIVEHAGDLRDGVSVADAVEGAAPDEVFHLAGATHPGSSREDPEGTRDVVAGGTGRLLDAVTRHAPLARVFCASSAEVFGAPAAAPQDEQTPLAPDNPYGEAKAAALEDVRERRERGDLWVAAGILYNHESPRRPRAFVTRKVTWHAAAISAGRERRLTLGNLDARRDWGHAREYADGARRALQAGEPADYVFATGVLHSVRDLVEIAFQRAGVAVDGHVEVDPALVRDDGPVARVGDPGRARRVLGWQASTPFEELIAEMVDNDMELMRA